MKRLFAILLSLLIVGAPTAAGMLITYRQAQARVAEEAALLADVEAGAPVNPDGTMSIFAYTAWILKEMSDDD